MLIQLPGTWLLLPFVLTLFGSQIIYFTSKQATFPSWLIYLGYHRPLRVSWPCRQFILEQITEALHDNLYSATKMGDLGTNLLFLCFLFFCLVCLAGLLLYQKPYWKNGFSTASGNSRAQILRKLVVCIKFTWLTVLLSCSYWRNGVTAAWDCR